MSTIGVALILIGLITGVVFLLVSINNKDRKMNTLQLLEQFNRTAMEKNLSFSSQELLDNSLLGLDGIQKKLLLVRKTEDGNFDSVIIDLSRLRSCSVKQLYRTVSIGTGKKEKIEKQIDRIVLQFDLMNGEATQFIFFDHLHNHISMMERLEHKAEKWEAILSKLIDTGQKKIA